MTELDLGRLSPETFFRKAEAAAGLPRLPDEVWIPAWRDIFEPDPKALGALARVRPGIPKILISNTNALHWDGILRVADVRRAVDACLLSFEMGAAKPEFAVFAAALDRAGASASEAVFADDFPAYVDAARTLGIDAFRVSPETSLEEGLARRGLLEPL